MRMKISVMVPKNFELWIVPIIWLHLSAIILHLLGIMTPDYVLFSFVYVLVYVSAVITQLITPPD